MITSAALLLRERGVAGTTVAGVLEHSGSPRGSVGFHFPGGRSELLRDALGWVAALVGDQLRAGVEAGAEPLELFGGICEHYRRQLETTDYAAGCPVWAVAQESYADPDLGPVVAEVVDDWVQQLARALVAVGHDEDRARDVAMLCVASLEGAITMCRLTRSTRPIDLTLDAMAPHLSTATA
ncbi:TetR/AcrR family transcriptional regulator [Nocardioides sp. BYT-33-1]|jgi:AcrR family transcriptional regulator|uniref:TetR/AcrR family transcriptional regulator n=1 Tax=Nocardioides sp. BYT-33-1 TaxID=3416952 RepID=UPI003F53AC69